MRKSIFLIIALIGVSFGFYGFQKYNVYKCTNVNSANWEKHLIVGCSVYYDAEGQQIGVEEPNMEFLVKIPGVNIPTFTEINQVYSKDSRSVYYRESKVVGANPKTFSFFGGEYYKDSRYVYWQGHRVPTASAETFSFFSDDKRYAKDDKSEYFNDVIIQKAASTTSNNMLLSPFDGDEVTKGEKKEIFWRQSKIDYIDKIAIALVGDNGDFIWLSDDTLNNIGTFEWLPYTATTSKDALYKLVFYGHNNDEVVRFDLPNTFSIVENGKPGVSLKINFSEDKTVKVSPNEVVYISWAASNVEKCYLVNGIQQSLIGETTTKFPQVDDSKVTEYLYYIECVTDKGFTVEDSVTIESIALDMETID